MFGTRYYYCARRGIGGRRLRAALLTSSALALAWMLPATFARAQDATWLASPATSLYDWDANWDTGTTPTGTAYFGATNTSTVTNNSGSTMVGGWTFKADAPAYTINNWSGWVIGFNGAGIVVNGGSVAITNEGYLNFYNASTAGSAAITNDGSNGFTVFYDTSSAGSASITNRVVLLFEDSSTAGSATIINDSGILRFFHASSAGTATIINNSNLTFSNTSTAGSAAITNNAGVTFLDSSTAGNATITNNSELYFVDGSTAGSATISNNSTLLFSGNSTAGSATLINSGSIDFSGTRGSNGDSRVSAGSIAGTGSYILGANELTVGSNNLSTEVSGVISGTGASLVKVGTGTLTLSGANTYSGGTTINGGTLQLGGAGGAGSILGTVAVGSGATLDVVNADTSGITGISNSGNVYFSNSTSGGNATITNTNQLTFYGHSTAGNAVIANSGNVLFDGNTTPGNAQLINTASTAIINFGTPGPNSDGKISAGSIAGNGRFDLNGAELTVGSNNLSTTVTGVLTGDGMLTGTSLIKVGTGKLTLSGVNTYTGATTIDGGTLAVNGSILSSSGVTVNAGGTLGGTGIVGNTTIASGGALAPGNSIGTLTVSGNLAFTTGSFYTVEVSPTSADRTNVTGTATLTGATVQAVALVPARFRAQTYTILNASGGFGGTEFAGLDVIGSFRPGARNPHLTYDANNVYLVLDPGEIILPSGTNANQASVAGGINRAVLGGATPPVAFDVLLNLDGTPLKNALTQISGETATGAQQGMFNSMTMFMGQMTDPFIDGRGDMGASIQGVSSYAADGAARRAAVARDAFAAIPPAVPTGFEQRWNVWAAGFGGSQTSSGNTALGSNGATSRLFGTAAGADYWFSAHTLAGFALAGGGTNFSVANGGTGRSDLFQAGAFVRHHNGPAYLSAALAYGWQDVTTDRTVTVAGIDKLQARFNANTFAGRIEGGYRFATPWMAVTPYAAGQVTTFQLPAYAESVLSGANTFALSYGAKTVTASRSELGLRTDRSWAVNDAILTLRGRAAWAHDFNPDRAAAATFQTLPGASFIVNGAAQARDSALTTAAAEMKWRNGFSLGATFEGEFSSVSRGYAGKGVVRYMW